MPFFDQMAIEAAPQAFPWIPAIKLGAKIKPSGVSLQHTYKTDPYVLPEADLVHLEVTLCAYQIHPATVAELAALGPVGGANAKRWLVEGPMSHRPGDPGAGRNCSWKVEVSTSLEADPGEDWRPYEPGTFRLRSVIARLVIDRPRADYGFRVLRFVLSAERKALQQRPRRVRGVRDVIPSGTCRVVAQDFEIEAPGVLDIEADGILDVT